MTRGDRLSSLLTKAERVQFTRFQHERTTARSHCLLTCVLDILSFTY